MAPAKVEMEDSDSEYDPSKIPANPPKTMTSDVNSSGTLPEGIIKEAEKDWEIINNVCARPMFAQTEEVEKALHLLKKWTEDAESRYGVDTMTYLRRKVIGPAADSRRTELQRILGLRQQVNPEQTSTPTHGSPGTGHPMVLPPIRATEPKSPVASRSILNHTHTTQSGVYTNGVHPGGNNVQRTPILSTSNSTYPNGTYQNGYPGMSNGVLPQPAPSHNGTDRRLEQPRPSTNPGPQQYQAQPSSLPPMPADLSRPSHTQQTHQPNGYNSAPSHPFSRGSKWIHNPQSDLWCPICQVGPLTCMHSHRLIGRLFQRGIKYSSIEEIHYMHQRLEDWAYRGHPLKMEPAMTRMYSLEELAAEQKGWIAELRTLMQQRPYDSTYPQSQEDSRRSTQSQPQYPTTNGVHGNTQQRYQNQRQAQPAQATNGYSGHARSSSQGYNHANSARSPAPEYRAPSQREDTRTQAMDQRSYERRTSSEHKRKRPEQIVGRRVRTEFRSFGGTDSSSSEDEEVIEDFSQSMNEQGYQKFNQLKSLLENMPKDQLSASVLRMCYSNTMILNWIKKELKKSGPTKQSSGTGESTLVTPTSPDSMNGKASNSPSLARMDAKIVKCTKCDSSFDMTRDARHGECQWHDGDMINKNDQNGINGWQGEYQRVWTCCGATASTTGCRSGKHSTTVAIKPVSKLPDRTSVITLTNPVAGRPALRNYSHSFSGDHASTYPGQTLVKALVDAEKESEKAALEVFKRSPSLRRSSISTNGSGSRIIQDFSPSLDTLADTSESMFDLGGRFTESLDLTTDSDKHLLHPFELRLASQLGLSCSIYLIEKRRFFEAVVMSMQDGAELTQDIAADVCKIEPAKARALFDVFEKIGWLEPKHFMRYLNDPSGTMINSVENVRMLPGIHDLPHSGNNSSGRPSSAPDAMDQPHLMARRASSGSVSAPAIYTHHVEDRSRKQRMPMHLPHAANIFQPLRSPGHLHAQRYITNGHMEGPQTVNLTNLPNTPPRDLIIAGSPETYQWRKNGNGKKMQVPICPYPRSWAEADSVDRELVRLKRHEGKQWEELFEWWRAKGRASLKNASCLAVRYSILKKNYEADWVREGL